VVALIANIVNNDVIENEASGVRLSDLLRNMKPLRGS
jgi:hypothetical protein